MKIGIDARFYNEWGIGRYLRNLISELEKIDSENSYFIFLRKKEFDTLSFSKNFIKILSDYPWYGFSEQIKFPLQLTGVDLDIMHFPHFNVPFYYNKKFVVTIHDLIHEHFHDKEVTTLGTLRYSLKRFGFKRILNHSIKESHIILTPTNFVKEQIINEFQITPSKIVVTHEGVDNKLNLVYTKISKSHSKNILEKYVIKTPYFLYVGSAHPHKNIKTLIKGFKELLNDYPNLSLVLVGKKNFFWKKISSMLEENIIFTDFVTEEELAVLYANSLAYVEPSYEEGFGLPVLEAMSFKVPAICSEIGALKEVGGDAALYFDPLSFQDLASKMKILIQDKETRFRLVKKGEENLKRFNFADMARKTLEVYTR